MKKLTKNLAIVPLISVLAGVSVLPACSWFSVYKIDIPQGTPISEAKLAQVQVGMNFNQVLYILGSPAVRDTLNPMRWDYIYDFTAGTNAKRDGKPSIHNAQQYVKIYFDQAGNVAKIERPN
ncbi:outer membrane protein assembly factor BamE [Moraxella sp. TY6]